MKTKVIILALALGVSTGLLTAQDNNSRPAGQRPPGRDGSVGGPAAGPGGERGGPGQGGFHLLPPRAQEQLNLTAEQQKQVAALEAETKAKLEKILTPEQLKQLQQMRPPQRQGGPGGPGGQGDPGGQGGQGRRGGPAGQSGSGGEGRPQRPPADQ